MVVDFRVFRYELATAPYPVGLATATNRAGLLLHRDVCGVPVWTEAAPLPGWSIESIGDILLAIRDGDFGRYPSLHFAYESLALPPAGATCVRLNALLSGSPEQVAVQAEQIADTGITSVKMKVGRGSVRRDIEAVKYIRKTLNPNQRLRLDANRAWSLADSITFGENCQELDIEYIEEPVHDPKCCEEFYHATKLPYALDETIVENGFDIEKFPSVVALIVKPTLVGGASRVEELVASGIPITFSSAFESHIGLAQIALMASRYSPNCPAGLDTQRWLLEQLVDRACESSGEVFTVNWPLDVDKSKLTEIEI